ncbi:hypothetical protein GCM10018793_45580 [Streptomyces sulfonofaciens]|uniref:Uncharacterized protein n=1 Tax=Streptomyces sulfonofaciens TaxID=68272 RepID=A0A919L3D1_9ACTN|nr:hypothetical protein GCM10018793_45580 [Streptomyces sulfonofaciens]
MCLLAAGAVGLDGWLHSREDRLRGLMVVTTVSAALLAVIVLPVLPPSDVAWMYGISAHSGGNPRAGPNWSAPCGRYGPGCRPDSAPTR